MCGERQRIAHTPSQDMNLMNTEEAAASVSEKCKGETVWRETGQQQASGQLQRLYVRRGIVLCAHTFVLVCLCVCLVIYTYATTRVK